MGQTLFEKVWQLHRVRTLPNGQAQIYVGLHLIHEVTSPQAFADIDRRGWPVRAPDRTIATMDHIVPTRAESRPFADVMAEQMACTLERNCRTHGIRLFDQQSGAQGIVHVIGPELGLTQPGMTITCGDSHTSTHGAFGAVAFGIGTSQVRDVLASQCLSLSPLKVRRINIQGRLAGGVFAKDIILSVIARLGVQGGAGYAYEYAGDTVARMSMDERMTLCNMSIEGGARVGYVNPDETTFEYLRGRRFAPSGDAFDRACRWWRGIASDADARWDDEVTTDAKDVAPTVTWGVHPGQSVAVDQPLPHPADAPENERRGMEEALAFMGFRARQRLAGTPIDVAFVGSCTNGRLSDLREAARVAAGRRIAGRVRALVVPGSQAVSEAAEREGLPDVFRQAGFEWRSPGCSMCLAMNPDRLEGRELCASSSNRNFKGRQGSPAGRTLLMSPAMVAAAAIAGEIVDIREWRPRELMTAIAVRGDDIDTDRIMPARFLKAISFDGIEAHLFADEPARHSFDDPARRGASVLLVGANFGCGSSREHAPQAIVRWGIRAIVGVSFGEIFLANAQAISLPCLTVSRAAIARLMSLTEADPSCAFVVDLAGSRVVAGGVTVPATLPPGARDAFLHGTWDTTGLLLERYSEVEQTAARLPYVTGVWEA